METEVKEMVIHSIYKSYPYFNGVKPTVRKKQITRFGFFKQTAYQFTFKTQGKAPDGTKIEQRLVVTASENGRILKTITSR